MSAHSYSAPPDVVLTAETVVAGDVVHRPGRLEIAHDTVVGVGPAVAVLDNGLTRRIDLGDAIVVPGFVDIHVHGGGGGAFTSDDPAQIDQVIATHRARGTTAMMASLVTAEPKTLEEQAVRLVERVERGDLLGIHLEGPWLSPDRRGAHDPTALRAPDLDEVRRLLDVTRGTLRMVTIAPELPGALAAIELLREHGVVAAVGHTDATYDQTREAIRAGATVATHLFNAMRPVQHREPGPVIALCEAPDVVVEVIADGVHVHPAAVDHVRSAVGRDRLAMVTDAMAATAMPDGSYELGTLAVTVRDGVARLTEGDSIAGGTGTTDVLFRCAAGNLADLSDDALLDAVAATSGTPARAIGLEHHDLSIGSPADLVVLDRALQPTRVMRHGEWVPADT